MLGAFVPQRYGLGSGLLIDSDDRYSRQTDVLLFDQSDEPAALAQTTQLLFPVENVLAAIEVKTTLRKEDIDDCFKKSESIRTLDTAREHPDKSTHPLFIVLAYTSSPLPATVVRHFREGDAAFRPDLVCVLGPGLMLSSAGPSSDKRQGLAAGLALLRDTDGNYVEAEPTGPDMMAPYEGRQYPIVEHAGKSLLADRGRALLLFVEALVRLLAEKQGRPAPVISHYVTAAMRELAPL